MSASSSLPHIFAFKPSPARPLLILKLGSTDAPTAHKLGDFEHWIHQALHDEQTEMPFDVQVLDPREGPIELPDPSTLAGVIITGSHAMVTDRAPWSEAIAAWLRQAIPQQLPTLGICYGHQLLADALGGQARNHPMGMELGSVNVRTLPAAHSDPLFGHMPAHFYAQVVHRQCAAQLPAGAVVLAANDWEPHQAFRVGEWAWGVQFHPEFSAAAMQAYVSRLAAQDGHALPSVQDTPEARSLLPRFAQLVQQRERQRKQEHQQHKS